MTPDLLARANALLAACRAAGLRLATAESCTGGLVAAALAAIPGASDVLERGFVTYSNAAKAEMLGVEAGLIAREGAVSAAVAAAMAAGALRHAHADLAVAVTGIAGPGGGSAAKPVGLVFLAACRRGAAPRVERQQFAGGRGLVQEQAAARALALLAGLAAGGEGVA